MNNPGLRKPISNNEFGPMKFHLEQLLEPIFDNVTDIIFFLSVEDNKKYRFLYINKAFLTATGLKSEQILGKSADMVIPEASYKIASEKYIEAIKSKNKVSWEEETVYPSGIKTGVVSVTPLFDTMGTCTNLIGTVHDISDIREAESNLKESNTKYQDLYENSPEMLISFDAKTARILQCNKTFINKIGYSKENIIGMPIFNFYHPDYLEKAKESFQTFIEYGGIKNTELQLRRKDGSKIDVLLDATAVLDKNGKILFSRSCLRDNTLKKEFELRLTKEKEQLRTIIDASPTSIWYKDTKNNFIRINEAAAKIANRSVSEVEGKSTDEIFPGESAKYFEDDLEVINSGKAKIGIIESATSRGKTTWVRTDKIPWYDETGNIAGIIAFAQDISAQKNAEDTLRENEERLKLVLEGSNDGFWDWNVITGEVKYSNRWAEMLGYTIDEIEPHVRTWERMVHKDDLPAAMELLQQHLDGKSQYYESEHRLLTKSGEWKWILDRGKVVETDSSGKPIRVAGTHTDITVRKKTEQELINSREEYRMFFEDDLTGDFISTVDGKLLKCNPAYLRILGFSSYEEALSYDLNTLFNRQSDRKTLINHLVETKKLENWEYELKTLEGKVIYVIANIVGYFNNQGELETLKGYLIDNTERKLAADDLRKLSRSVEQSPASVIITDTDGNIEYVNPKFSSISGYSLNDVLGKTPRLLKSGHTPQEEYEELWSNITSGKDWFGELLNKRKDGSLFWEYASISSIQDKDGKITHFVAVKEDITDKKKYELELIKAKDKAEESDRLKTAFLHNISHEIRTPMNAIVGFSGLLDDPDLTPETRKEFINVIEQSSNQLLSVITDLFSIATIEAGQEKINIKDINLNEICKLIHCEYLLKAGDHNIHLEFKTGLPDKEAEIRTDETKLVQVLSNIVGNAIKFTEQGSVNFGYKVKGNFIEFYIADTGIGIPKEMHEDIFVRFRQVENSLSRQYGGTGLGLSISKSYIELLGGKMWFTSELNKGSVFYFTIPFNRGKSDISHAGISQPKNEPEFVKPMTILVAEDEVLNFKLLEQFLSGLNFSILHASNGLEAVEICKSNKQIDLILMDLKMPVMNGFDAIKQIREFMPDLPIIAQTAYSTEEDKEKTFRCGCSDFISKPFSKESLLSVIKKQIAIN